MSLAFVCLCQQKFSVDPLFAFGPEVHYMILLFICVLRTIPTKIPAYSPPLMKLYTFLHLFLLCASYLSKTHVIYLIYTVTVGFKLQYNLEHTE